MKKVLALFCGIMMSIAVFADKSASCAFQSIPGAYVVAEAHCESTCNYCVYTVKVTSYGVKEGAVIVQIQYETADGGINTIEQTIYISNGKGEGSISSGQCAKSWTDFSVNVYNAICHE